LEEIKEIEKWKKGGLLKHHLYYREQKRGWLVTHRQPTQKDLTLKRNKRRIRRTHRVGAQTRKLGMQTPETPALQEQGGRGRTNDLDHRLHVVGKLSRERRSGKKQRKTRGSRKKERGEKPKREGQGKERRCNQMGIRPPSLAGGRGGKGNQH